VELGIAVPAYGPAIDPHAIGELVAAAEELDFASVWWPDHIAVPSYATANMSPPFLEPLAACAWGLGATERIRFGVDVLVAPYRHPLTVAAGAATMATLGGGRLVLGIGIGYLKGEFEVLGVDYETRAARTEAWLAEFRSPPEGYSVTVPPEPVPLWVAGNRRRAWTRAALLGDGWHPLWMPPEEYRAAREEITRVREEAGVGERPFTFSFSAGATRLTDRPSNGWAAPPPRAPEGSEFRYAPEPWIRADGRPGLCGTPDDLISDLRSLEAAGVEHVTLRFGTTKIAPLERFASEVAPAFSA
jgi:alkanesulfonate monooxygenase SsuD/methylene tetrahydromethanopterin reductase-like flavin-dependent oxidoreductase (luciferase family)